MTTSETEKATANLVGWFESIFDDIEEMSRDFAELIERDTHSLDSISQLSDACRSGIKARSLELLGTHAIVDGAGLVFSRFTVGSIEGVLEWWVRDDDGKTSRYSFGVNPTGDRFYDYERLEWFTNAFTNRSRSVVGPYIDYLGVEEYIVTLTVPVLAHGGPVGVGGIDIRMHDFETALTPLMQQFPRDAALLNQHGSVLMGNSGRFVSGDRVARAPEGFAVERLEVSGVELRLLHH